MATNFRRHTAFTVEVAKALNLDPGQPIASISIDTSCSGPATVTVKYFLQADADDKLAELIKKYGFNEEPIEESTTWRDKESLL